MTAKCSVHLLHFMQEHSANAIGTGILGRAGVPDGGQQPGQFLRATPTSEPRSFGTHSSQKVEVFALLISVRLLAVHGSQLSWDLRQLCLTLRPNALSESLQRAQGEHAKSLLSCMAGESQVPSFRGHGTAEATAALELICPLLASYSCSKPITQTSVNEVCD